MNPPSKKKIRKILLMLVALILLFLAMVWARAFYGSMKTYQRGEQYFLKGQTIRAITFFERSIQWYTPFNPYVRRSIERLWEIGIQSEANGDMESALIAYRTIRAGLYGSRSFYTPFKGWVEKCNLKIHRLLIKLQETKHGELSESSFEDSVEGHGGNEGPRALWSFLSVVGFLGWVGSIMGVVIALFYQREKKRFMNLSWVTWIYFVCAFVFLWIIGMVLA